MFPVLLIYVPARQPCIISSLPFMLEVMKMTSAPKLSHVSLSSCTVFGRPPRFFESQRIILSGSILLWIRPAIVGPKVFSWSEPIQIRNLWRHQNKVQESRPLAYQFLLWMQVDSAAPIPVPVQIRIPFLNIADACPTPAIIVQQMLRLRMIEDTHRTWAPESIQT